MTKQQKRQDAIMRVLHSKGTGVVTMSNKALAALIGCSESSIKRDLDVLDGKEIIIRETNLITKNGETRRQRDIILPGEEQRRFTINQHRQLKNIDNHFIYTNQFTGEVVWKRRLDGEWQRTMQDKEFISERQAYGWLYHTLSVHHKKSIEGDKYTSRSGRLG